MSVVLSMILVIIAIMNISVGMLALADDKRQTAAGRIFFMVTLASVFWCVGYGLMGVSPGETEAYIMRAMALFGVFSCCAFIIRFNQRISGVTFPNQPVFDVYVVAGGLTGFVMVAMPQAVSFNMTSYGRYFLANLWPGRYFQYFYLLSLFAASFYIGHQWGGRARYKRERMMVRYMYAGNIVITLGALFDAVFPLFGRAAFPSSAISTFFYIQIIYRGLRQYNSTVLASAQVARTIFSTIAVPVVIVNEQLEIIESNAGAGAYLGISGDSPEGASFNDLLYSDTTDISGYFHTELKNLSEEITLDASVRGKGYRCFIVATPIYDKYGETLCIICLLNDRSETERLEKNAAMNLRRAHLSEESRKSFIEHIDSSVSAPVKETKSFLLEISQNEELPQELRCRAEQLSEGESLAARLIDELVDISQIQSGRIEITNIRYDLEMLLSEVISEACERIDELKVRLITRISPAMPKQLIGDSGRLKQVLSILLDNAVQHTAAGRILFSASCEVSYGRARLSFRIYDTGGGMDEEKALRVFGMPREDDGQPEGGSSISLALCGKLVRMMGGRLLIRSAHDEGCDFGFEIEQYVENEQSIVPAAKSKSKAMIIMDDNYKAEALVYTCEELDIQCELLIRDRIDSSDLTADDSVTIVLAGAGILGRMRLYISQAYKNALIVPVYSYKNYQKLMPGMEGVCGSLIFSHIRDVLHKRNR